MPMRSLSGLVVRRLIARPTVDVDRIAWLCDASTLPGFAFDRAGAHVTEVPGASHVVMISRPRLVADEIDEALVACQAIPYCRHSDTAAACRSVLAGPSNQPRSGPICSAVVQWHSLVDNPGCIDNRLSAGRR
jgi:hypothetical protein